MFFLNNNKYDIIIIGGGITGLFLTYKLCETDLDILLVESTNKLGGRIQTIYKDNMNYEAGAARFHETHSKLITLIHELNLSDKIIQLSNDIHFHLRGYNNDKNYSTHILNDKLNYENLLKRSYDMKDKYDNKILRNITFFQYLCMIFDYERAEFIKDSFGYDSEFYELNSEAALEMFQDDFIMNNKNYYCLKNGLSEIIHKLEDRIQNYKNVKIIKNCHVENIIENGIITKHGTYYFNKLICTIPRNSLKKIKIFNEMKELDTVENIPLLRIYFKYPKDKIWFKNMKRTITNNHIRHIIPIDIENGLIMISYIDGKLSKDWDNIYKNNDDFLIEMIHNEIYMIYSIKASKPEFVSYHLCNEGIHFWKPGVSMIDSYFKILRPFKDKNIFIGGESYCRKQGWIEGCLDNCYDILKLLDLSNIEINLDKDYDLNLLNKKKLKEYTIQDVLKHKNWIIIEYNHKKFIYNLSNWIHKHPGGDIIMKGIYSNKYYLDKIKYPQSPIMLFNEIHKHKDSNVFENYFLKENEHVKLIGILK